MTTDRALDLALEALKIARDQIVDPEYAPIGWSVSRLDEVLSIGKQARSVPVQEPVGTYGEIHESMQALLRSGLQRDQQIYMAMKDKPLYATPPGGRQSEDCLTAAQPAPVQGPLMVDIHPPATQRDRWMYEQGRLAERDPRSHTTPPAAQRQWVGLAEEEIEKACVPLGAAMLSFTEVARAIEAKLKEKNNG
jgi:hypothetical protein